MVPRDLEQDLKKTLPPSVKEVAVSLVDKTSDEFVPPKPKFDFAKSQGQSLGSSNAAGPAAAAIGNGFAEAKAKAIQVDESQPTTTVQIVLANKSKVQQKFNQSHTVLDLFQHIKRLVDSLVCGAATCDNSKCQCFAWKFRHLRQLPSKALVKSQGHFERMRPLECLSRATHAAKVITPNI